MAGIVTHSTSLNSFWSIIYCLLVLGVQSYAIYTAIGRYHEASGRAWPGGQDGRPVEVSAHLALIILSILVLPFFVLTAWVRVGNYGNDGIKLGRDHALNTNMDAFCKKIKKGGMKRIWQHFCPMAQTFHLISAFFLVLPETVLSAVEVQYGYRTTDAVWTSDMDFLFARERAHLSDVKSSINITEAHNETLLVIPTPRPPPWGWTNKYSLTVAFVNFAAALITFSIRYSSVFWFTNKILTAIFAFQMFFMTLTSVFGYCGFSVLYKVCYNLHLYQNVHLSLGCAAIIALYIIGGIIMVLSTMTVFKYGAHYFEEKFKIIERKHNSETYVKQTVIVHSGCQGYIPHSCAMAALIFFAVCKGPILYNLVSLYRVTKDGLVLACVVCEVCYMVFWIVLWFGLTIKQQWRFRILDYVPLGQPVFMINSSENGHVMKNPSFETDNMELHELHKERPPSRNRQRESPPGYLEALSTEGTDDMPSEDGTDNSDNMNLTENPLSDMDQPATNGGAMRKSRNRRNGGQRVTFDESVRSNTSSEDGKPRGRGGVNGRTTPEAKMMNVTVDVHNGEDKRSAGEGVLRRANSGTDNNISREYRNSIRNKCGEYYSNVNNLSTSSEEAPSSTISEPLPTLMSSFRDKVKESSRTANNYKEQSKSMFPTTNSLEKNSSHSSSNGHVDSNSLSKRKGLVESEIGEVSLKLNDIHLDNLDSLNRCKRNSSCNSDDSKRTSTSGVSSMSNDILPMPNSSRHLVNGTNESPDNSLKKRSKNGYPPLEKSEYLFPRPLHLSVKKGDIGRRDSANYSLTSSQETSSNDSDQGQGLCSQNGQSSEKQQ
ncbi:uncharacterized protein LOC124253013 [Haliotis rubra]|uniref:uncharacterized protein LOC124253013 n=1 Tax=Haliotis rubra TaxID=36100 RepID=UPI001EE5473E|nr:uncharacterized protein LOC124253013 [Haliotis rubra]